MANYSRLQTLWDRNTIPIPHPTPYVGGMPYGPIQQGSPSIQAKGPTKPAQQSPVGGGGGGGGALSFGSVHGDSTATPQPTPTPYPELISTDPNDFYYGGGGGGGGVSAGAAEALAAQVKAEQQRLADAERGNIEGRRDALIKDFRRGYDDQSAYLDTQVDTSRQNAKRGRERVNTQRDETVNKALQDAELAARTTRDTYRDMILQGRRRARATGGGSSSGYLEMSTMLDQQLMRGLGQVENTKQGQVGTANRIADTAVGEIEASLQQVLNEISNNRTQSLRERDRSIDEAKLNAADALLEVDKWLTQTFSDIESARLSLRTGGGGRASAPKFNKDAYAAAQAQNQAALIDNFNNQFYDAQNQSNYDTGYGQRLFSNLATNLMGQGMNTYQINNLRGMYFGNDEKPTTPFGYWQQQNPGGNLDDWFAIERGY